MLGSAAYFAFHLGAPVPGSAGTWISLPIDAPVTALTAAQPRVILTGAAWSIATGAYRAQVNHAPRNYVPAQPDT
jgi:hypothetical protein